MRTNFTLVGASLSATLTAAALAGGPAWENLLVLNGTNELPTLAGAVMVPNSTNNPVIDGNGDVTLRLQLGGAGITTANSRIVYHGHTGAWSILARDGSAVPSNTPAGYVFNTTTGINGLASSNNISESGGVLVSGSINGTGNSTSAPSGFTVTLDKSCNDLKTAGDSGKPFGGGNVTFTLAPADVFGT